MNTFDHILRFFSLFSYMSKKVCSLASKEVSVICCQKSRSSAKLMEGDVMHLLLARASNNSSANSPDSFIPAQKKHIYIHIELASMTSY